MTFEEAIIKEFNSELPSLSFEGEWYVVEKDAKAFLKQALAKYKAELLDRAIARCINEREIHLEENTDFVESINQVIHDLAELKGKNE